jgi:2-oxoglutarate dehydrogenase E2 component (dihydrolipoamide succinyltransferase)
MVELIIPRPGESINEVVLSKWFVNDGDLVEKDQEIGEIESDKATLPLIAPEGGKVALKLKVGETITVGSVACIIDNSVKNNSKSKKVSKNDEPKLDEKEVQLEKNIIVPSQEKISVTPVARKLMEENHLSTDEVIEGLRRIGKAEVQAVLENKESRFGKIETSNSRESSIEPMSQLRKKLSKRLVTVKNETAMLTTFNEVDMSNIIEIRSRNQKLFTEKHGIKLGFMSFFSKAATIALQQFPKVNSQIENDNIVIPSFVDIAIAVQTDKGLMVPVIRNTENKSLAEIEKELAALALKAKANRLSIDEMTGGTFTITNGGVFGSMLSTPIINPPQSAILGMHNIVERPVAINGKVEIRPIMYVALSYDHRIIDGRDSVSFLMKIKELIESPLKMISEGKSPEELLLGV